MFDAPTPAPRRPAAGHHGAGRPPAPDSTAALNGPASRAPGIGHRLGRAISLTLGLCCMVATAHAADPERRVEQMRDAARRAQQALQQAQAEQVKLQDQNTTLAAAQAQLQQGLRASEQRQREAAGRAQGLQQRLARLQAQHDSLQAEREALKQALAQAQAGREEALQQRTAARQQAAEQRQTLQSVLGLLGRNVQALAQAETHNRALLRLGQEAADHWARATPEGLRSSHNPLGGFAAVRLVDQAETLKQEMAKHQVLP